MSTLTRDEIVRGLMEKGAPREAAERCADDVIRRRDAVPLTRWVSGYEAASGHPPDYAITRPAPAVLPPGPVSLRIPWSALVSDDNKYTPVLRRGKAVMILTDAYREAKRRMMLLAIDAMAGRPPQTVPLAFVARVWVPNNHRRDVQNFSKCCLDALTKVVYADDSFVYDSRWVRAGVDVDAPRAEITITPLTPNEP